MKMIEFLFYVENIMLYKASISWFWSECNSIEAVESLFNYVYDSAQIIFADFNYSHSDDINGTQSIIVDCSFFDISHATETIFLTFENISNGTISYLTINNDQLYV